MADCAIPVATPKGRTLPFLVAFAACIFMFPGVGRCAEAVGPFDVVIAGGSTAAFAAAISAADSGARVALLEPTDWVGGQITSSGVPAIDEAWHKLTDDQGNVTMDVAKIARTPANMSPLLRDMLLAVRDPQRCWVSRFCFQPREFLDFHLHPLEKQHSNLTVLRETVVKRVDVRDRRIVGLTAVQRFKTETNSNGYDHLPSEDLADWYAESDSDRFRKRIIDFVVDDNAVFIDATEWGELLALTDAPYLIGVEQVDGQLDGDDRLGQSTTFGFVQEMHETEDVTRDARVPNPKSDHLGYGDYRNRENAWSLIWTYRRLKSSAAEPKAGDLSLQNWGYYVEKAEGGNDYPFGYLFLSKAATRQQQNDWLGGVDLKQMAAAEQRAFAWHHWFKDRAPDSIGAKRISLSTRVLGTGHGLSKLPYIRDTRRSIGLDGFVLAVADLQPTGPGKLAKRFDDRVAIGAYPVDIHPMADREYPPYIYEDYDVAPFTIPFRALTNDGIDNLLVAGKTMAQSFLANSATRLHPTEWSTGTAAGVAAWYMVAKKKTSRDALSSVSKLQAWIEQKTPIDWTLESVQ